LAKNPKVPASSKPAMPQYTRRQRVTMAKKGWAIPITNELGEILDGSFPIQDKTDIKISLVRYRWVKNKRAARAHIKKRIAALGAQEMLPASWLAPVKHRGRPVGAPSLTNERQEMILGLIRKGVFDHVAAAASGVSARALREWIARGEGRSSRPSTTKLRTFAAQYRRAKAEARAFAEARAYDEHLLQWLKYAARSTIEGEGWSELPEGFAAQGSVPLPEELATLLTGIRNDLLYTDVESIVPPCPNRRCRCVFHHPRGPVEQDLLRAMAEKLRRDPGEEK